MIKSQDSRSIPVKNVKQCVHWELREIGLLQQNQQLFEQEEILGSKTSRLKARSKKVTCRGGVSLA